MYKNGLGQRVNLSESLKYIKQAADQGLVEAQYFLGTNGVFSCLMPSLFIHSFVHLFSVCDCIASDSK
jgi:hypothetical protein